ncbi:transposase [Arcicella lustrica]|uniref:Transposase n=1 Tax=Arcicella lustrica TaxID=2984196 RepID=A0ABU5SL99_9BACT|nr:transposase [Arcicella sp. DC25W]MEA5427967.1 transposase [Arcicella sp. DC25W]
MGQRRLKSEKIVNEPFKRKVIEEYLSGGVTKKFLLKKYNIRYQSAIQEWMKKLGYEDPYCNVHIPNAFEEIKLNKQKELDQTSRSLLPTTQNVKEHPVPSIYQG